MGDASIKSKLPHIPGSRTNAFSASLVICQYFNDDNSARALV
jgi:hypothetical protein